ncbi:MAG TPA: hypothetical protein DDY16_00230 [Tenacibaculum sp.]|nr:hypothetical protein [Tenacibaculum sp.]
MVGLFYKTFHQIGPVQIFPDLHKNKIETWSFYFNDYYNIRWSNVISGEDEIERMRLFEWEGENYW